MSFKVLTEADRKFFLLVADATFCNPFSSRRQEIDRQIAGMVHEPDWSKVVPRAVGQIQQRLGQLDAEGCSKIQHFDAGDRELMMYTYLFEGFHRLSDDFDKLIDRQRKRGDEPVKVGFAEAAIASLEVRGFTREQAVWVFAMYYQIRRAFRLIDTGLIGPSDCMRRLRMDLWNNIFTYDIRNYERYLWDRMEDFSTLLEGPTGCGKGAAAAAIGTSGFIAFDPDKGCFENSFTRMLIDVNLAQFTPGLIESELFGHAKGAFTGAVADYEGVFGRCARYSTIFLDEISEIRTTLQVKLLRVLQERTYWPVGSHRRQTFRGRVIGATNQPVAQLLKTKRFREDFYYRLCADCIPVPSLRQRIDENKNELADLVRHFITQIIGQADEELTGRVLEVIDTRLGPNYPWPGNVRELAQCIRRVILKRDYESDLAERRKTGPVIEIGSLDQPIGAPQLLGEYCRALMEKHNSLSHVARLTGLDRRTVKKYAEQRIGNGQ